MKVHLHYDFFKQLKNLKLNPEADWEPVQRLSWLILKLKGVELSFVQAAAD